MKWQFKTLGLLLLAAFLSFELSCFVVNAATTSLRNKSAGDTRESAMYNAFKDTMNTNGTFREQDVTPNSGSETASVVLPGTRCVDVQAVTTAVTDFIVLPSLSAVPVGHEVMILCNAGGAFEMRTPAASAEEINSEDCDGTKEYLCTDTQVLRVIKISDTIGWMANAWSAIGTAVTAVIPD